MKIILWLPVLDGTKLPFDTSGTLLYKIRETGFVPDPTQDRVVLYGYEDEPYDGPMWPVRNRYMQEDGIWNIELAKMVVDPNEHWQNVFKNDLANRVYNRESAWYIDRDGDPLPKLLKGKWNKYEGKINKDAYSDN